MRIGAFELTEPVPELRDPHAFAMVRPWVDVGSVGTLTLNRLERFMGSKELGRFGPALAPSLTSPVTGLPYGSSTVSAR